MTIQSINPATEEVIAEYPEHSREQVEQALAAAAAAQRTWATRPFADRSALMRRAAAYLREHKSRFGRLITLEMGKPIEQSEAEVEKCAWGCDYYAEHAEQFLADTVVATNARRSFVAYQPLGVVLAVMPWNFPLWQVFRFAAPALMAGNGGVLKHASNVPQCALAIEEVFREAGFPEGLFRTLLIPGSAVAEVIADPRIAAVTLTGSDVTGAAVAATAGRHLKKCVLELGGSDPYIVLDDADVAAAAKVGAMARNQNSGQSCIAAKRFIVTEGVAAQFEEAFAAEVSRLTLGDPLERGIQVGPMARGDLRAGLHQQVQASLAAGARVAAGGGPLDGRGFYYRPTVITNVRDGMPVWDQETFGPAAAVIRVPNDQAAVAVANDSVFGLGASLWTQDLERGERLARQIEAGSVFVNGMVASDPRLPFGGIRRSGYGRELSDFGIREFVNIKSVWIGPAATPPPAHATPSE